MKAEDWAKEYARHKVFCIDYFEGRADIIIQQSQIITSLTNMGPIQALDICMQVEAEFRGRVEEFVGRALQHPQGFIIGMSQYITYRRVHGG